MWWNQPRNRAGSELTCQRKRGEALCFQSVGSHDHQSQCKGNGGSRQRQWKEGLMIFHSWCWAVPGSTSQGTGWKSQVPLGAWEVHFGCSLLPPRYVPTEAQVIWLMSPVAELYTANKDLTSQFNATFAACKWITITQVQRKEQMSWCAVCPSLSEAEYGPLFESRL